MAKTISNLLVGVGFDLDKKSADGVASGIDGIKSKALKLGAIVAGAFGIKALTSDFAASKDDLFKFAQVFGSTANEINAFGNALRLEGGTLSGFMAQLSSLEKLRAGLIQGDASFFAAAGKAGLDTQPLIEAKNATEGYLALADQFQKMSKKQRINAASALGLDEASIRLLSKGRAGIEAVVEQQKKMRPITDEMTAAASRYNDEMQDLTTNIGGFADKISTALLPRINNVVAGMNSWIEANRELLNSGTDSFLDKISNYVAEIGLSLGLVSAGVATTVGGATLAKAGSTLGMGKVAKAGSIIGKAGGLASRAGAAGLAFTGGLIAGDVINENFIAGTAFGDAIGSSIAHTLAALGFAGAKDAVERTERSSRMLKQAENRPIVIHSTVKLDGKVIDKKVQKVVGEMANQTVQDMTSTEAG